MRGADSDDHRGFERVEIVQARHHDKDRSVGDVVLAGSGVPPRSTRFTPIIAFTE